MHLAIGADFESIGIMERELLVSEGLRRHDFVVDVGCGSGRLAVPLASYLRGPYLGTDVVPELLDHAHRMCGRPDWRFEVVDGLVIPAADATADFVCFFSVFTHLRHEESFRYLEEAKRVLKPGGRIVLSFLEFAIHSHWAAFEQDLARFDDEAGYVSQFMSRDGIEAWAEHLELDVCAMFDGDRPHIPLPEPVVMDDGRRFEGMGALGQSVAVLSRRHG
jgi:ubiquinone/menaquinone biosynthesis C-methylase UbiE